MENISAVLSIILPILVTLSLGFYARQKSFIQDSVIDGIKKLVMHFMLPAVLLNAFYKNDFSSTLVVIALCMFGCCIAGCFFGKLLSPFFKSSGQMLPFLTSGFEAGMMGYGLYAMLYTTSETYNFALVDLGQVVFVFTVYMALLNKQKNVSGAETFKSMITSPVFLSIAIGVVLSATKLGPMLFHSAFGPVIDSILGYISAPTGVLMLFVVGYQLILNKASLKAAFLTTAIRSLLMLGLGAFCIYILQLFIQMEPPLFWAVILMFTLPPPFVLPIFSDNENQSGYVATTLSLSTLLSILFFVVITILR